MLTRNITSHNKKFKADSGSSCLRYNQLLCGRPHWGADVMTLTIVKILCCLVLLFGLIRNYVKEKDWYFIFRKVQHIITIITVVLLFAYFFIAVL